MPRRRKRGNQSQWDYEPDEELDFESSSEAAWLDDTDDDEEEWSSDDDDDDSWRRELRDDQGFDPEEVL